MGCTANQRSMPSLVFFILKQAIDLCGVKLTFDMDYGRNMKLYRANLMCFQGATVHTRRGAPSLTLSLASHLCLAPQCLYLAFALAHRSV